MFKTLRLCTVVGVEPFLLYIRSENAEQATQFFDNDFLNRTRNKDKQMKIQLNRLKHVGTYQSYESITLPNGVDVDGWHDKFKVPYGIYVPTYNEQLTAQQNNETVADIIILVRHNSMFDISDNTYALKLEDGKTYKAIAYVPTDNLNGFDRITLKKATS